MRRKDESSNLPPNVWKITGSQPGPRFVILGGVHGDELTGIEVVKILRQAFNLSETKFETTSDKIAGELIMAFGNPVAIARDTRAAEDGPDLNRSFSKTELNQEPHVHDRYDLVRARELAPFLANCDFMLDIHATCSPSEPFVCLQPYIPKARPFISRINVRYVLSDPDCIYLKDEGIAESGTTDSYVIRHGGIGVCYETGYQKDLTKIPATLAVVGSLFLYTGLVTNPALLDSIGLQENHETIPDQKIFQVTYSEIARYPHFTYADSMDSGWHDVTQGDLVGTYENGEQVRIPHNGMYVFPKNAKKIVVGKNLFTLVEEIKN